MRTPPCRAIGKVVGELPVIGISIDYSRFLPDFPYKFGSLIEIGNTGCPNIGNRYRNALGRYF